MKVARSNDTMEITQILAQIEGGDVEAANQLLPQVYDELRKLAAHKLARETPGQTLQATALVHEAYVRLVGQSDATPTWANRGHFFSAAAEAMRRILIENARRKRGPKQGGHHHRVEFEADAIVDSSIALPDISPWDLLSLDEALTRLAAHSADHAQLVMLRFFAGLTMPEAANALGVSLSTAERQWAYTRAWLFAELRDRDESAPEKA